MAVVGAVRAIRASVLTTQGGSSMNKKWLWRSAPYVITVLAAYGGIRGMEALMGDLEPGGFPLSRFAGLLMGITVGIALKRIIDSRESGPQERDS